MRLRNGCIECSRNILRKDRSGHLQNLNGKTIDMTGNTTTTDKSHRDYVRCRNARYTTRRELPRIGVLCNYTAEILGGINAEKTTAPGTWLVNGSTDTSRTL